MKKVALIIPNCDDGWIGGLNYYGNLLSQCQKYVPDSVDINIIISPGCEPKIQQLLPSNTGVLTTRLVKRYSFAWLVRNSIYVITGRDFLMESFLVRHGFDLLTHSPCRNYGRRIKSIGWIPDVQHKYLPDLFSKKELDKRDKEFQDILNRCDRIVLSSRVAFDDVLHFYKVPKHKLAVLHFYKQPEIIEYQISKEELQKKFDLPTGEFFFLPNQFWAHKNHSVVIEAINILKLKGKQVLVVCSGNTHDYRNPDSFKNLMDRVNYLKLQDNFKVLGLIPMTDVNALIIHSMALINPSLFEGWSTTAEEARAYGKRIVLSDISVHKEQSPPDALFFKPDSTDELANCIEKVITNYEHNNEELRREKAQMNAVKLCADFANKYAKVVDSLG